MALARWAKATASPDELVGGDLVVAAA